MLKTLIVKWLQKLQKAIESGNVDDTHLGNRDKGIAVENQTLLPLLSQHLLSILLVEIIFRLHTRSDYPEKDIYE